MMQAEIQFHPLDKATLKLALETFQSCDEDPIASYSRLFSATMVAGAILGLSPEQVSHHTGELMVLAKRAVAERPDIFGERG